MKRIITALACFPLATYMAVLGFATYVYLVLGSWPKYGTEIQGSHVAKVIHIVLFFSTLATFLSLFGLPVGITTCQIVLRKRKDSGGSLRWAWALFAIGAVVWAIDVYRYRCGLGGLSNWILD
jgi:hypothetical protein